MTGAPAGHAELRGLLEQALAGVRELAEQERRRRRGGRPPLEAEPDAEAGWRDRTRRALLLKRSGRSWCTVAEAVGCDVKTLRAWRRRLEQERS